MNNVVILDINLFEIFASKGAYIRLLTRKGINVCVVVFDDKGIESIDLPKSVRVFYPNTNNIFMRLLEVFNFLYRYDYNLCYSSRLFPNLLSFLMNQIKREKNHIFHVNGLGRFFSEDRTLISIFIRNCIKLFYHLCGRRGLVIFQNHHDPLDLGIGEYTLIEGAGVRESNLSCQSVQVTKVKEYDFCFVSRLTKLKGLDLLLSVAIRLPEKIFAVVGDCSHIDVGSFPPNVRFLGFQRDVVAVLRRSKYFLFPSRYREGVPRSVLEALFVGMPVIVPNTAGCFGLASRGNGEIFDVGSSRSLYDAVNRVMLYDYDAMCIRSRQLYNIRYSADKMAEQLYLVSKEYVQYR